MTADMNVDIRARVTLKDFFHALREVETGGMGLSALSGKNGEIGPYQITKAYWLDAWIYLSIGPRGNFNECQKVTYSEETMIRYWLRFVPGEFRGSNWEVLARTHNGGPHGARKASTLEYWFKVRAALERRVGAGVMAGDREHKRICTLPEQLHELRGSILAHRKMLDKFDARINDILGEPK